MNVATAERADGVPLWTRSVTELHARIAAGGFPDGRLPAERALCAVLGVSRVTLRRALAAMVADGTLVASAGRGWFVAPTGRHDEWPNSLESFSETARRLGLVATSEVIVASTWPARIDDAESLLVAPGSLVFELRRLRMLDGIPVAIDHAVVPLPVAPHLARVDFRTASLYDELARAGVVPADAETTIDARPAEAPEADDLGIAPGAPTLVLRQLVRDRTDRPVLSSVVRYAGERYRLRTSFVRSPADAAHPTPQEAS